MTSYGTPDDMRKLNGLPEGVQDPNYVQDSTLQYYLDLAAPWFLDSISIESRDEPLTGTIDGSNTKFLVSKYPMADKTYDNTISSVDVEIYGWGNSKDLDTKTSLAVASVNWREGRVILSSGPSGTYDVVTGTYRYYLYQPNWELFLAAESYLAGQFYFRAEYMEIPEVQTHGATRFRIINPATRAARAYYDSLSIIRKKPFVKGKAKRTHLHVP